MLPYLVALAVLAAVALLPPLRRAVISLIGIAAIAAVSVAGIGLSVWGLYEAKPWLVPAGADVVSASTASDEGEDLTPADRTADDAGESLEARLAEQRAREEEQRLREERQRRIEVIAQTARSVIERERTYAVLAASAPRMRGLEAVSSDLVTVRIPSWRDRQLAEREQGLIRAWLQEAGLTPEETAAIVTANGWGSVYDLWVQENPGVAQTPIGELPAAPTQAPEPPPVEEPVPETRMADRQPDLTPRTSPAAPRRNRQETEPSAPEPARRAAPAPEVGPFGY